jgi:FkbM family methyltransferase
MSNMGLRNWLAAGRAIADGNLPKYGDTAQPLPSSKKAQLGDITHMPHPRRLFKNYVNRLAKAPINKIVRSMAARSSTRKVLNYYYNTLGDKSKSWWHRLNAELFRNEGSSLDAGDWSVTFLGATIRLPLRPEHSWLDWDSAISILGHDIEIKTTYARLITSSEPPEIFLDVGANYGTHSILFSSAGIPSVAFEPNPRCMEYCRVASDLNNLHIRWEPVAIGDRDDEIELVFPERETWLGSVSQSVTEKLLREFDNVVVERVTIRKLDHYAKQLSGKRVLLKIDVEGAEAPVLRGASTILKEIKPTIIFESNDHQARSDLFSLLKEYQYNIRHLPWTEGTSLPALTKDEFCTSSATNFLGNYRGDVRK